MTYISEYNSILGKIIISADEKAITGLYFKGQKYFPDTLIKNAIYKDISFFSLTKKWLDDYFCGKNPVFLPPFSMGETSQFRKRVWEILLNIPYGKTTTYGSIAKQIELETGKRASAQAVGGAVGKNPISIIIPCHRVVGVNGSLTGYAGGIDKKTALLKIEGVDVKNFTYKNI